MRELKFRVWDNKENKYLDPKEIAIDNLGNVFIFEDYQEEDYEVWNARVLDNTNARFIIEQYTGIKDQNDKEIYAGDIVSVYDGRYIGSINQYPSGEWKIIWVAPKGTVDSLYAHRTVCEVIGNIHENPELLEDRNN